MSIQNNAIAMKTQLQFNSAKNWKVYTKFVPNYDHTSIRAKNY